jgi:hypothetical protein
MLLPQILNILANMIQRLVRVYAFGLIGAAVQSTGTTESANTPGIAAGEYRIGRRSRAGQCRGIESFSVRREWGTTDLGGSSSTGVVMGAWEIAMAF